MAGGSPLNLEGRNRDESFSDMNCDPEEHAFNSLSLWLSNAKVAAATISEAALARHRKNQLKQKKIARNMHSPATLSFRGRLSPRVITGRQNCTSRHQIPTVVKSPATGKGKIDTGNLRKQARVVDTVRGYIEEQLRKNRRGRYGISKLHRECMMQALMKERSCEMPLASKTTRHDVPNLREQRETDSQLITPITEPFFLAPISKQNIAQMREFVVSKPCSPTGWNVIPTSFPAFEIRSLGNVTRNIFESASASETRAHNVSSTSSRVSSFESSTASDTRDSDNSGNSGQDLLPKEMAKQIQEVQSTRRLRSSLKLPLNDSGREKIGKENVGCNSSLKVNFGNTNGGKLGRIKFSPAKVLSSQNLNKQNTSLFECFSAAPVLSQAATATKGERVGERCLRSGSAIRLERSKVDRRHMAVVLREKALSQELETAHDQTHPKSLADKREQAAAKRRRRASGKKRSWKKGSRYKSPIIPRHVKGCETEEFEEDPRSPTVLLGLHTSKTWSKFQALHKQQYLNSLAEKRWMSLY